MNNKLAIVVDSGMDVPNEFKERYPIFELPFQVIYKDKTYEDRINIQPSEIYQRLKEEIPTTSLPSGERIHSLFNNLQMQGYTEILVFSVSDKLSGTYQFIKTIAEDFNDLHFEFFNTQSIGIGAGFFAIEAAQLAKAGCNLEEIKQQVFNPCKSEVFFKVETLEYLQKGGRINTAQASIGKLLNIQPIITCDDNGNYVISKKVRHDKQFYKYIDKKIEEAIQQYGKENFWIGIAEGDNQKGMNKIYKHIISKFEGITVITSTVSPALGVHTGPGLLGIGIYQL